MANKNLFTQVLQKRPGKNVFDLSHDVKLSCNMGDLIPILNIECVPGDKFNISAESLLRFMPMTTPVMHRCDVTMHYFFVPNRITWDGWEDFIAQKEGAPAFPYISMVGQSAGDFPLLDYFGLPPMAGTSGSRNINVLPFAAYQCIWNEYYRDQNLQAEVDYKLLNGNNFTKIVQGLLALRKRAWEHDYFTSALPFAQKGSSVEIPLGDVTLKDGWENGGTLPHWEYPNGTHPLSGSASNSGAQLLSDLSGQPVALNPGESLGTDPTTITDLRRAFRLQEFLEKMARGGSRYFEMLRSIFGVQPQDARLQRPEYITGIKSPVVISEVLNTTGTEENPQGNMSGHGIAYVNGNDGHYYCHEHGYIVGIMSILPKTAYQQGIPKTFLKGASAYDFYLPDFANIGEQPIELDELYGFTTDGQDTFGYTPRYAEYKYESNRVAGKLRTDLWDWHMGRVFTSPPALNATFIESNPTHRIFAVTDPAEHKIVAQIYNKVRAVRPMPYFGTPTI